MPRTLTLALLASTLAALAVSEPSNAQRIYKCTDASGAVTFQNVQCPDEVREERPSVDKAPTLTPEEQFRAEAASRNMTPEQLAAELVGEDVQAARSSRPLDDGRNKGPTEPVARQGGFARAERPSPEVLVCTRPDGSTYTTDELACDASKVRPPPREWSGDTVQGLPGAVMTGPNTALDPRTGRTIQLLPAAGQRSRMVADQGEIKSREQACAEARERRDYFNANKDKTTFDQRRQADDHVRAVCRD